MTLGVVPYQWCRLADLPITCSAITCHTQTCRTFIALARLTIKAFLFKTTPPPSVSYVSLTGYFLMVLGGTLTASLSSTLEVFHVFAHHPLGMG